MHVHDNEVSSGAWCLRQSRDFGRLFSPRAVVHVGHSSIIRWLAVPNLSIPGIFGGRECNNMGIFCRHDHKSVKKILSKNISISHQHAAVPFIFGFDWHEHIKGREVGKGETLSFIPCEKKRKDTRHIKTAVKSSHASSTSDGLFQRTWLDVRKWVCTISWQVACKDGENIRLGFRKESPANPFSPSYIHGITTDERHRRSPLFSRGPSPPFRLFCEIKSLSSSAKSKRMPWCTPALFWDNALEEEGAFWKNSKRLTKGAATIWSQRDFEGEGRFVVIFEAIEVARPHGKMSISQSSHFVSFFVQEKVFLAIRKPLEKSWFFPEIIRITSEHLRMQVTRSFYIPQGIFTRGLAVSMEITKQKDA